MQNDPHMASALYKAAVEAVQEWGQLSGLEHWTADAILALDEAEVKGDYTLMQDLRDFAEKAVEIYHHDARRP